MMRTYYSVLRDAMDQEPLVIEQIEAGRKFIEQFDQHVPVRAAFWLKANEDSGWHLHIASDQITDENFDVLYGEVASVAKNIDDPSFDLFRVKLIGTNDHFRGLLWTFTNSSELACRLTSAAGRSVV